MKYRITMLCCFFLPFFAKGNDTIPGFHQKISGEESRYFSPLHQFANTALLTRVNGEMPIEWKAPVYSGNEVTVTYELLIGHSTGTSTADRHFAVELNEQELFTITTPMKKKGSFTLNGSGSSQSTWKFVQEEYDVNGDAFGKLYISVPATQVNKKAVFRINGVNEKARDWLMVFMYKPGLKGIAEPTNLVTQNENRRQLNLFFDMPWPGSTIVLIHTRSGVFTSRLIKGYNSIQLPVYPPDITGIDTIRCVFNERDRLLLPVELKPVRDFVFSIIHHSHNDIGYSHLQSEVEAIQNRNIRDAIHWINEYKGSGEKPMWHIESLWSVENFLRTAGKEEEAAFVKAVKSGQLVLSANYANILTGLGQPEELNWVLEYAKQLEERYGLDIKNGMITDIPGISRSGLLSYVNNNIPYLSLGPNYVESHPDHGDRVGGVIREQGDRLFYWKPDLKSDKKLLVWTAGKGYSYFHGISESEKQVRWERRISDYCNELIEKKYPYDLVQLRYTKNADNGPVDTGLHLFVEKWNQTYRYPQLKISSVDELFASIEKKYSKQIPVYTGEISPYWEDGAYSTAEEEMLNRELAIKTIALEKYATRTGKKPLISKELYLLHKNIVLFHEHTWGAWCSISDPDVFFTTEQWRIKKQFVDSAQYYYDLLAARINYQYAATKLTSSLLPVIDFTVDPVSGAISQLLVNKQNQAATDKKYKLFEPVYLLGVNPSLEYRPESVRITEKENTQSQKIMEVTGTLKGCKGFAILYTLNKINGAFNARFRFDKTKEREKESLHIAFPFAIDNPQLVYGNAQQPLRYPQDHLAGSNKEFVCVEKELSLQWSKQKAVLSSPGFALWEIGSVIDESRVNGAKVWKREEQSTSTVFLYLLNNYWHTNYKADQEGIIEFAVNLEFRPSK